MSGYYRAEPDRSGLEQLAFLSAGFAAAWFLFSSRRRRFAPAMPPTPAAPVTPVTPSIPPFDLSSLTEVINGATWSNIAAFTLANSPIPPALQRSADLTELSALQDQIHQAVIDAHADLVNDPKSANDPQLSEKAIKINQVGNQVDTLLGAKVISMVGDDITALKSQADSLTAEAAAIPNATRKIDHVNSFLSALTGIIGLLGG